MADSLYDFGYWDLPEFHCELMKPICDEARLATIKVS